MTFKTLDLRGLSQEDFEGDYGGFGGTLKGRDSHVIYYLQIKLRMKSRPILMFILLMVICDVGANLPKLPIMQCPVGTSLDSAFFFGQTLSRPFTELEQSNAITAVNERLEDYKGKTQDELRTMLKTELGITVSITDEELINRTSVAQAVKKFRSFITADPLQTLKKLEEYVEDQFSESDVKRRWFNMFRGYLTPQDVTLLACDAEIHLPKGKLKSV